MTDQRLTTGEVLRNGVQLFDSADGGSMVAVCEVPRGQRQDLRQVDARDGVALTHDRGTVRDSFARRSVFVDGDGRRVEVHFTWKGGEGTRRWWFLVLTPEELQQVTASAGNDAPLRLGRYKMAKVAKRSREQAQKSKAAKSAAKVQKSGGGQKRAAAPVAPVQKATPAADQGRAPRGQLVFGRYPLNGVLLLMGMRGFTVEDAHRFVDGEGLQSSPITVQTRISTGQKMAAGVPHADRGRAAELAAEDLARLDGFKSGGAAAPAVEAAPAEPVAAEVDDAPRETLPAAAKARRATRKRGDVTVVPAGQE